MTTEERDRALAAAEAAVRARGTGGTVAGYETARALLAAAGMGGLRVRDAAARVSAAAARRAP